MNDSGPSKAYAWIGYISIAMMLLLVAVFVFLYMSGAVTYTG